MLTLVLAGQPRIKWNICVKARFRKLIVLLAEDSEDDDNGGTTEREALVPLTCRAFSAERFNLTELKTSVKSAIRKVQAREEDLLISGISFWQKFYDKYTTIIIVFYMPRVRMEVDQN